MNINIFSDKEKPFKEIFPKNTRFFSLADFLKHSPESDDITYYDISNTQEADIKKTLAQIKKICGETQWGILDPKGNIRDPAVLFFEGSCDYIGYTAIKEAKSIDIKRVKEALQWQNKLIAKTVIADLAKGSAKIIKENSLIKTGIKFPPSNIFPGWKQLAEGKTMPFYLLYCSLQGKTSIESRFEEKTSAQIHKRFLNLLTQNLNAGDGLLWIDSGKDCLFLIPPKIKNIEQAAEACMKMIISAPVITMETLAITIPVNFIFALHYGSLSYKPPGKTGTIISDAVNAIFHLGTKKAESGRLTITSDIPDGSIPKPLEDCFFPIGVYEGRKIWHSKKFNYEKDWC
ncbi:MAG: hypothetical protein FWB73_02055 [Treponema sp.]|nr:hypothetical protein [Treponema sp.]